MIWRQWNNFWIFGGTQKGPLLAFTVSLYDGLVGTPNFIPWGKNLYCGLPTCCATLYARFEDSETIFGFLKVPRKGHFQLFLASFIAWRAWRHPKRNPQGLRFLLRFADMVCLFYAWKEDSGIIFGFLKVQCACRHPKYNPLGLKFLLQVADMVCSSHGWSKDSGTIFWRYLERITFGYFWPVSLYDALVGNPYMIPWAKIFCGLRTWCATLMHDFNIVGQFLDFWRYLVRDTFGYFWQVSLNDALVDTPNVICWGWNFYC